MWFVYIIETSCGKLYTGISTDVERRFSEHLKMHHSKSGKGAKFFMGYRPEKVVWKCQVNGRSEASQKEAAIKKMSVTQKRKLISV